jgi:hypothetical protein
MKSQRCEFLVRTSLVFYQLAEIVAFFCEVQKL